MKLITFAVPCYNSEAYMSHCIETILSGGEEVEIIIIDDGSKDRTAEIADSYAEKYPSIVRAVHKENGGHGSGVNRGIQEASGLYYKVVDSDDWLDEKALKKLLKVIRRHVEKGTAADLYLTNFIYDHVEDGTQFVRDWRDKFPSNRFCSWKNAKRFHLSEVILMHSILYRTEVLRESGTVLPEHTFYVDNIYAYKPLPYMKRIFYLDVDLYHYFIGRADQSVNMNVFVNRYDQQIRVMKAMIDAYSYDELMQMTPGLRRYMFHTLDALMIITLAFTICSKEGEDKRKAAYQELWDYLQAKDEKMYRRLKKGYVALSNWMPWGMRRAAVTAGYKAVRKVVKLG